MSNIFNNIKKNNFLVVGRAGLDLFTQAGEAVEDAQKLNVALGGSAANIAVGICKLGGKSQLVTRVSDDSIGSYCLAQLSKYGVGTQYVRPIGGEYRNSLALYESRVKDHRSVIYRNGAADFQMDAEDIDAIDYVPFGALITAGTVFASEPSREATFTAIEQARKAGLSIVFDVDYRPYSWPDAQTASQVLTKAAQLSDVIVGNDEEFGFIAGDYAQGLSKARELAKTTPIIVYKMGEEGAITFYQGEEILTGIYQVEALKPTGAGDSFMAAMMTSLADGLTLETAILRGSAYASITVSRLGCASAMATPDELDAFIASHSGPTSPQKK